MAIPCDRGPGQASNAHRLGRRCARCRAGTARGHHRLGHTGRGWPAGRFGHLRRHPQIRGPSDRGAAGRLEAARRAVPPWAPHRAGPRLECGVRRQGKHRRAARPGQRTAPEASRGVLAVHRPARLPRHLSGDHPLARHPAGRRDCFAARGRCLRCGEQARDGRHVRAGGDPARDQPAGQRPAGPR